MTDPTQYVTVITGTTPPSTQDAVATTQAGIAAAQAVVATTEAQIATTQAGISTTQAGIATTQASAAAGSATSSASSASTATTQAGVATTQAGIAASQAAISTTGATTATTQAGVATGAASTATTQATTATSAATTATTQATNASGSATAAASSASTSTTQAGVSTAQASTATTQAGIATTQATAASGSASTATTQAGISTTQASAAAGSASAAATSAAAAAGSATTATSQASAASTSAGQAASSAASITGAVTSSAASAALAGRYANDSTDVDVTGGAAGERGAKFSAAQASGYATAASNSATAAATSAASVVSLRLLAKESGYIFGAMDGNNKGLFAVDLTGAFVAFNFVAGSVPTGALATQAVTTAKIADGNVTLAKLDTATVTPYLLKPLGPESGYMWGISDAANRLLAGVQLDGTFVTGKYAITAGSVQYSSFSSAVLPNIPTTLPPESGYIFAISDAAKKMLVAIQTDGTFVISKFAQPNGSVTPASLASSLTPFIATALPPESGYIWAVKDAAGKGILAVQTDGTVMGKFGVVTEAGLAPVLIRSAVPHVGDVVEVMPDKWRSTLGSVGTMTSTEGTAWTQFPRTITRNLRGKNLSGTSLQFRRSSALNIKGSRDGGSWNPVANASVSSSNYLGELSAAFSTPSTVSRSAGDYYRYAGTTTTSFDSQTMVCGDLVSFDGTNWKAQLAPRFGGSPVAPQNNRLEGDFWTVSAAGTFNGITYAIGDKIVHIGFDSESGNGQALWYKGKPANGDLFYRGEFVPGTASLPASPAQGDVYQASAGGTDTTSGIVFATSDYAIYDSSTWGIIPTDTITTVASNALIPALKCYASTAEWEVRRTDKSATRVGVLATCMRQTSPRRSVDSILLASDSMFGVMQAQSQLATLVNPRTVNLITRGGGTSRNVLSSYENYVANLADPYMAEFVFWYTGQNNFAGSDTLGNANFTQIIEAANRFAELAGARDRRFCFLSVLGQNSMTFNGTRIVVTNHENALAGTGGYFALEQWYAANWPGKWLSPRQILLAAAASSTTLDVRVPGTGLTEAQTAALYGWIPFSYWAYGVGGQLPMALNTLNLVGYWSSNAFPTGGSAGDCYTVSATGLTVLGSPIVGAIIVNVAGTWTVFSSDVTHLGGNTSGVNYRGGTYVAAGLNAYLTSNVL